VVQENSRLKRGMLIASYALVVGLVVGPPTQVPQCNRAQMTRMCDEGTKAPSLITQAGARGFDLWGALAEPFAAIAGLEYEPSGPLQAASAWESAEIDFEQFCALLDSQGDALPEDKMREMFDAVDAKAKGKIEFVQCYKAILDESRSRDSRGGGFFGGLFGSS
jgi:hypothetical protein